MLASSTTAKRDSGDADRRKVRPPHEAFGFPVGADRRLVRWPAMLDYFRHVERATDRVRFEILGAATDGQPLALLTISSPDNLRRLESLQAIQQDLADPAASPAGAKRASLVERGRAIVLVTCSIHATEVGAAQMTPELVYRLATRNDARTARILDEVVLLLVPSLNPDGMELVADWYHETLGTSHEGTPPPELYHPYAGHDNNRDWFMQSLVETRLVVSKVHNAWRPHIVYDLHQMQSNGPRYVLPPFVDPYDPNVDPLIQAQVNALGTAIAAELIAHGKTGVATSIIFDAFSPSRSYQHYHGGVRILSEAASARIASPIHLSADELVETRGFNPRLSTQNHPTPWPGGRWSLADIVEHNLLSTEAVLDHAARHRDQWVRNFALIQDRSVTRDRPFAFLIPPFAEQRDPGLTSELIDILLRGDVEVGAATSGFTADEIDYQPGTWVIPMAQPFGGFAKTLLEVQDYPDLQLYPGGPPRPPYDNTAHTLPLQMGVAAVRVAAPFDVATEPVRQTPWPSDGSRHGHGNGHGNGRCVASAAVTGSYELVNAALVEGAEVGRSTRPVTTGNAVLDPGAFVIEGLSAGRLDALAQEMAVELLPGDIARGPTTRLTMPRIGLYRSWRPNAIDAGWTKFVLDRYRFPFTAVRDRDIRQGMLGQRLDVLIFAHEHAKHILEGNSPTEYPARFAGGIGEIGAAHVRRFVEDGGTLIALDGACELAIRALYLPVTNVLEGARHDDFYSPGSLLRLLVDPFHPIGWGYQREAAGMFVSSPAFEIRESAGPRPVVVAQYPIANQLLSGWIRGADRIAGRAAIVEAPFGRGRAILIGIRPQFRAQARSTYRLLFNGIYRAGLQS